MSYVYIYPDDDINVKNAPLFIDLNQYPYWDGAFTESIAKSFFQGQRVKIRVKHPHEIYYSEAGSPRNFNEITLLAKTQYSEYGDGSKFQQSFVMVLTSRQVITAFSKLHTEARLFHRETNVFNLFYQSEINEILPSFEWFGEWKIVKKEPKTAFEIAHPWALISMRNKIFPRKG